MQISLIVAMDQNHLIGNGNKIPWKLPNDLRRVKKLTENKVIIMGERTFKSIGHALPNRKNVVLTDNKNFGAEGCWIAHSIEDVFDICKDDLEVIIFGGAMVYELFLPYVTKMYLTYIFEPFKGDVYFPDFDFDDWEITEYEYGVQDIKNNMEHAFFTLIRK